MQVGSDSGQMMWASYHFLSVETLYVKPTLQLMLASIELKGFLETNATVLLTSIPILFSTLT